MPSPAGNPGFARAGKKAADVILQVEADRALGNAVASWCAVRVPLPNRRLGIEQVNRAFDKYRTGHAILRGIERLAEYRYQIAQTFYRARIFYVRAHQRHLVDVLQ